MRVVNWARGPMRSRVGSVGSRGSQPLGRDQRGGRHTCALDDGGALYCWGENSDGQLGDGTTTRRATPVRIASDQRFQSVAAGDRYGCALSVDDGFPAGQQSRRRAGAGNAGCRAASGSCSDRADGPFSQLAAGTHSCAIDVSGVAWCWGRGVATPAAIGEAGFIAIAVGPVSACGVGATGRIACWGDTDRLQLGSYGPGTSVPRPTAGPFCAEGAGEAIQEGASASRYPAPKVVGSRVGGCGPPRAQPRPNFPSRAA